MDKLNKAVDDEKLNSQYKKLLANNSKSASESGESIKDNPKGYFGALNNNSGNHLMTFTQMLESLDDISDSIDSHQNDIINTNIDNQPTDISGDDDLIDQLNKIFTPVLIMQGFENDSEDIIKEALSEASLLTEKSIIKFDDDTRMAQLRAVCALLIARKKNSEKYKMYAKAHEIKRKMKLDIQKEEYDDANTLAQKYLVSVSTTNNSPVARKAANALLPATQH